MNEAPGSDKLFNERFGKSVPLSEAAVAKLIDLTDRPGVKIVDWTIVGIPAPDRVVGTIQVPLKDAGELVQRLVDLPGTRTRIGDSFPYGIVVPEGFQLTFNARGFSK